MILINTKDLRAIVKAASKDATRYHLDGVLFKDGYMFSTDGYILSFKYDESYLDLDNFLITSECIKAFPKNLDFEAKIENDELVLMHPNYRYTFKKVQAPNIKSMIPDQTKPQTTEKVFFNAKLLDQVIKASYMYSFSKVPKINIVYGQDSISSCSIYVNDVFTGVIMPMRGK